MKRIVSLNIGLPRQVVWHGRRVLTGIFKNPVEGRVTLRKLNLENDRQADLTVHGGEHKAVYCYPITHYRYWREELPETALPMGAFGENFTVDSFSEDSIHLGDRFSVGTAEVIVTQPRMPCYKLGIRFQADDMVKNSWSAGGRAFILRSPAKARSEPEMKSGRLRKTKMRYRFLQSHTFISPKNMTRKILPCCGNV